MPQSVRAPCATRCDLWPRHDLWPSDPGVTSTAGGHWPTATLTADDLPWRWLAAICDGSRSLNTPNDRSWRQRPLYLNVLTRFHITGDVRTPHIAKNWLKHAPDRTNYRTTSSLRHRRSTLRHTPFRYIYRPRCAAAAGVASSGWRYVSRDAPAVMIVHASNVSSDGQRLNEKKNRKKCYIPTYRLHQRHL